MNIRSNYSPLFSSINGSYNASQDMSNIISQRNQIQSGSYGKLMRAYVDKVGNKNALKAYQETGNVTNDVNTNTAKNTTSASKNSFLDSHLSTIGKSKASVSKNTFLDKYLNKTENNVEGAVTKKTGENKYDALRSDFLDERLKMYDNKQQKVVQPDALAVDLKI